MTLSSMTGFCSVEGVIAGRRMRVEMRALNHRGLDLKTRLPRDLSEFELPLRARLQSKFARGAIEVKVERAAETGSEVTEVTADLPLAKAYLAALQQLRDGLGLADVPKLADISAFPT